MPFIRKLTHNGITMSVTQWAKTVGMPVPRLFARLRSGKQALDRLLDPTPLKRPDNAGNMHNTGYIRLGHQGRHVHRIFAEHILGKPLPKNAIVHHVNGNKTQHHSNIVICQDRAYHSLLHTRQRAYEASGNASWRKCKYCKKYDDPKNLTICINIKDAYHKSCMNRIKRQWLQKKGEPKCHGPESDVRT